MPTAQFCPADKPVKWCQKRGLLQPLESGKLPPIESLYTFVAIAAGLLLLLSMQRNSARGTGCWLPAKGTEKREYEVWVLRYSVVWMGSFGVIIAGRLYEMFDATAYFVVCGGLAAPLLLQPLLARGPLGRLVPTIGAQHAARAQLWIAVFGFIGNCK